MQSVGSIECSSFLSPAMAPVGLLMAVAGYILGIYAALGCAEILRWLAI